MLIRRALVGGLLALTFTACSFLDPLDGFAGPTSQPDGAAGSHAGGAGGQAGDANTTDAQCATADDCDDSNPCTLDGCWGDLCTHTPAPGTSCSDGNVCNGDEACDQSGKCAPGKPLVVDDGNTCTDDSCDPVKGVSHSMQTSPAPVILQCGSVICPAGYFVRKLTCLSECGACNPVFCVNGTVCERVCAPKHDVCCGNECGDDCPAGYSQTAEFTSGDCGCGPGKTATCKR